MYKILLYKFLIILFFLSNYQLTAQEIRVIDNKGTIQKVKNNHVTTSSTEPVNALEGDVWYDSNFTPNETKIYDGDNWLNVEKKSNVYTGYFIVDYNAGSNIIQVTGIPFQPSQVTFVAHANVDSIRSNGDNPNNNSNTVINSFGTMNGFANISTGTLVQQVIYVGGNGNSINDIGWFSDDRRCIGVRFGNQNGDNLGVIEGELDSFTATGFNIDIDYSTVGNPTPLRAEKLVVLYTAYK